MNPLIFGGAISVYRTYQFSRHPRKLKWAVNKTDVIQGHSRREASDPNTRDDTT